MYTVHIQVQIDCACGQMRTIQVEETAMWNVCGGTAQEEYVRNVLAATHPDWKLECIVKIDRDKHRKDNASVCPKCGSPVAPGLRFCTRCGTALNATAATSTMRPQQPMRPVQPSAPAGMRPQQPIGQPMRPMQPSAPAGMRSQQPMGQPMRPMQPMAPKGAQPMRPMTLQSAQPMRPQQAMDGQDDTKGVFSRIGAGLSNMAHGGSFSEGYANQREREHQYESLDAEAQKAIKQALSTLAKLKRDNPEAVSAADEVAVDDIIAAIQNALNDPRAESGARNGRIEGQLNKLRDKINEIRAKADPSAMAVGDHGLSAARRRDSNVPVVPLHDVNQDEMSIVRHKAIWGIQPGQIGRRVTERELDAVSGLNGFIIQEGCSAMIFVNGELVDMFESGAYNVPQKDDRFLKAEFDSLYAEMERQDREKRKSESNRPRTIAERGGVFGVIGQSLRHGWEFLFGASPAHAERDRQKEESRKRRLRASVERALARKNPEPVLSIILISTRFITLTFGGVPSDQGIDYAPYTIPTKIFDVEVGVSLQLKVTDFREFVVNYLTDRNSVTSNDMHQQLNTAIEAELRMQMRNLDYEREGLAPEMQEQLKLRITELINRQLHGIECAQVLQITDSNKDFERFRQVERELYCSEKELEYLQRTNEFRNRLEQETNNQQINTARNQEDLRYALQQINKDQLLHDDELEEFVLLLNSQKRLREARTQEEEYEALTDLRRSRLVKDDEMAALEDSLVRNKISRDSVTEVMRIQAAESVSRAQMLAEWALSDANQDHEWEREDLARKRSWGIEDEARERQWKAEEDELRHKGVTTAAALDIRRQMDAYADERYDIDQQREQQSIDRDFANRQREREADWDMEQRQRAERRQDEQTDYDRTRQNKFDNADLADREVDAQIRKLQAMTAMQAQLDAQKNQHEENLQAMEHNERMHHDDVEATMTAEQLRERNRQNLSEAAQVASFGIDAERARAEAAEAAKADNERLMQQMLQMQQANQLNQQQGQQMTQQQMMQMMQMMMQGMTQMGQQGNAQQQQLMEQQLGFQQQRLEDQQKRADEYKQDARHQQERMDANMQQSLNYTTNVRQTDSMSASENLYGAQQQQQQSNVIESQCWNCNRIIRLVVGTPHCPECGAEFVWQQ